MIPIVATVFSAYIFPINGMISPFLVLLSLDMLVPLAQSPQETTTLDSLFKLCITSTPDSPYHKRKADRSNERPARVTHGFGFGSAFISE